MSPGKLAAQCVHAAALAGYTGGLAVVVLQASDVKFRDAKGVVVKDAGVTELEPGTETCKAYYEYAENEVDE